MAATPFKATLSFVCLGSKRRFTHTCTASDVTTEALVFEDAGTDTNMPGGEGPIALVDVVLSAAGVDCSQLEFYVNGTNTGRRALTGVLIGTIYSRMFQQAPLVMKPGARLKIVQLT